MKCKEIASNKTNYGVITQLTPKFRVPKATKKEWELTFASPMPMVIEVLKVTNAVIGDKVSKKVGYEWIVPNSVLRSPKDGSIYLRLSSNQTERLQLDSLFIVNSETPHIASNEELDFIKEHLSSATKQTSCIDCKLSGIIMIGSTSKIDEAWNLIKAK